MINHVANTNQSSENRSFNIYVDLFDKGEFNEMNISCESDKYHVGLDDMYLGTLSKNSNNDWEVISGTIPSAIIPDIAQSIIRNNRS